MMAGAGGGQLAQVRRGPGGWDHLLQHRRTWASDLVSRCLL